MISDLYEGGRNDEILKRAAAVIASGDQFIVLLARDDQGAPSYDKHNAAQLVATGAHALPACPACSPA